MFHRPMGLGSGEAGGPGDWEGFDSELICCWTWKHRALRAGGGEPRDTPGVLSSGS